MACSCEKMGIRRKIRVFKRSLESVVEVKLNEVGDGVLTRSPRLI